MVLCARAWTTLAMVIWPAPPLITRLVIAGCAVVATGVVLGGAGAIFVGVFVGAVLTRVTFPPANLTVGLLVNRDVVAVVPVSDSLFTTTG